MKSGNSNKLFCRFKINMLCKKHIASLIICATLLTSPAHAQDNSAPVNSAEQYNSRAQKIVNTLELKDPVLVNQVVSVVSGHYVIINNIQAVYQQKFSGIRSGQSSSGEKKNLLEKAEAERRASLRDAHSDFILRLQHQLNREEIDRIKDGMTYNVLHVTYGAYCDMIPSLKKEEKAKIYEWLLEARELAIDEGSSKDKHAIFGKYKGKINNFLSKQGYDMKAEEKAWQERIKQRNKKTNS